MPGGSGDECSAHAGAARGTKTCPDLRGITHRLDDLYGGYVAAQARRVGDVQTVGLYMELLDDRFAMEGDSVLAAGADFLRELLPWIR